MYIVGHTALAYLLIRPFIRAKDQKLAVTIFFIFIFANIIDLFNYSFLRYYGHNLIGTFFIASMGAIIFTKLKLIEKKIISILMTATATHVLADVIFSEYYLFAPLNSRPYSIIGYNPFLGQFAESILFGIFMIVIILTKDYSKLIKYLAGMKSTVFQPFEYTGSFTKGLVISAIFIAFFLFSMLQLFYFLYENTYLLIVFAKRTWLYFGAFTLFIMVFAYIGFYDRTKALSK